MVGRDPCSRVLGSVKHGKEVGGFKRLVIPPGQAAHPLPPPQTLAQALAVRVSGDHSSNSFANQIGTRHVHMTHGSSHGVLNHRMPWKSLRSCRITSGNAQGPCAEYGDSVLS